MKTEEKFEALCLCLSEMDEPTLQTTDFKTLCHEFNVEMCEMNNMMYAEFGMSGDEIINRYS